ncbi:hypothetical protein B0I33_111160 [Prauserella shujinwangii]|uniref:Uncharacterized protein n=1 Tax=Prauserella shujinwangii TaxID=1453103 RepID=A0A2T0LN72_9PSEU|nr:hypothetical protein [Prauserella shujinwangii]PRX44647.1 hypothetical protein B0I33_111160 [Prauserella shujinwangii]
MCGACGDRAAADWARPLFGGPAARAAAGEIVARLLPRRGPRVSARSGGWLVRMPTGGAVVCAGLTELVATVRPWGPEVPELAPPGGGHVPASPPPDGRTGIRLRVDPAAPPRALGTGTEVTVPDERSTGDVLARLATVPWSLRCFLLDVTGVAAAWGGPAERVTGPALDVVVWLEWARQAGAFAGRAVSARCPLAGGEFDVEVRAGHVVRARAVPAQ